MKNLFTKLFVVMILVLSTGMIMAQTYTYPVKGQQGFTLTEKNRDGMHINYQLGQFTLDQLNYRGEAMSEISIKGIVLPNTVGSPNLPVESRMIAIPNGAKATLNVVHYDTEIIHNVNIAPALRIQDENEEPDMDYKKDMKVYSKNAYYPENPFVIGESYIRGVDAVTLSITPFQYNPVTKDLVVYTNIELSLSFKGGNGQFGEDRLRSPYWDPILAAELMNYDQLPVIDYEARMQQWLRDGAEGAEYLIITPNNDEWAPYAQQLKEFRMKQGIITEVYRLDEMPANTTDQMKAWFHNAYHNWDIAPVAVCLLGDHGSNMSQYIPAEEVYHSSSYGNCITDNRYADAQGGDNLPDMVFSRLVAQNPSELPVFVSKQIDYETSPNLDADFYQSPITALGWQTERWFQICSEVFGGYMRSHNYTPQRINCIYSGTPGASWSSNQNTSMVVDYFGPSGTGYIPATPTELGNWNNGSAEMVVQAVNNGAFWLQHRDHGYNEGWGEPDVSNAHIDQMNNVGKLPFVMSINCQTGQFDYTGSNGNCFAEKWMRRTYNGQNAGAVGVLCPTQVSYSFVNDAFVWGVYDLFDGDFMPDYGPFQPAAPQTGNWKPAFGNVAGKYFLAQSSWPYNPESKDITYTMFTAHCDAFLNIFTQVPQAMNVSHQDVQLAGATSFFINAPAGTTISLTKGEGSELEIVAVATATGSNQEIEIPMQVPPTILHLTVTGQNYLRYEANIEVIPASGPYLVVNEYSLAYEATQLNFGEDAGLNFILKNVGVDLAPSGTVTLTSDSEYVTITNGTIAFEAIDPDNTLSLSEPFAFTVSDEVPNKTSITFYVTINSGDDTYESHFNLKAYAPEFNIGSVSFREINGNGNGRLDPGETIKFTFPIQNKGNAASRTVEATLDIRNDFMVILGEPTASVSSIAADATETVEFQVYISGIPSNNTAEYALDVISGVYTDNRVFTSKIGLNVEDFETAILDPALWTNDAATPWTFETENTYEGNYCLKSGNISHSQETSVILTYEVVETDNISFWYKVSSEQNYDKLHFYIDNVQKNEWSGSHSWTEVQYQVTPGTHTFKWSYTKDTSVSSGDDCCWIDFIQLPRDMSMTASAGIDLSTCEDEPVQVLGYASNYQTIQWTTSGDGTFSDATIANPVYTAGTQDVNNGSVTLSMTTTGSQGTPITDEITVTFYQNVVVEPAIGGVHYCAIQEPQPVAVTVLQGESTSFVWTTLGSGEFGDPSEMSTTYTPSAEDIATGAVTLLATATSEGCGPVSYEYNIVLAPMPEIMLETLSVDLCEEDHAIMNFSLIGVEDEATVVINGEDYVVDASTTSIDLGGLSAGTTVFNITEITQGTETIGFGCSTIYGEGELTFTANMNLLPQFSMNEVPESICEGEEVTLSFNFTGVGPFTVETTGMESFTTENESYSMTITPSENIDITVVSLTEGHGCSSNIDQNIHITVNPKAAVPEISGDNELDVRLTPVSTYTIINEVMVQYTLEPEEAGIITGEYDDAMTIDIEWNQSFKGEAVLTAEPIWECNNGGSSMTITVKNTTNVNEFANSAKIYPNPTNEKVNIECVGMSQVTVFNALGQMVYNAEVDADKVTISTESMPAGSYLVRIITAEGSITKHLNVIK